MGDFDEIERDLFGLAEKVNKKLSKSNIISVSNQELTIETPELLGRYSVAVQLRSGSKLENILRFPFSTITNMRVHSMPDYSDQSRAISNVAKGYEISLNRIQPPSDSLLIDFEFRIKNERSINKLVRKDVQRDNPRRLKDEIDEYWMHAQLKYPAILQTRYGQLDLKNIDFGVNVGIHQDLKTAIPSDFVRNLRIISKWIKTKDRVRKWRLGREHLHLKRRSYTGKEDELISDIQALFLSHGFKRFIEVTEPFKYYESIRGIDFYELPFQAFPKNMTVISRTTLNLKNPAAEGRLVYKKQVLRDEISRIMGIRKKKRQPKRRLKKAPIIVSVTKRKEISPEELISKIEEKLRPTVQKKPEKEREVQEALENLFIILDFDFDREQVTFSYSTKACRPDFTSDTLRTAIDVKLCKTPRDEKRIIDEINADIPAYKSHYENLLFVVYDLGCIRKVRTFKKGIEKAHKNVFICVIKH